LPNFLKKETWCGILADLKIPNNIQPREYSKGSGQEDILHIIATFNQWNDERKVNVNRNDNDWNDNWWFAGVRQFLFCLA
jgi:hypothetical protein